MNEKVETKEMDGRARANQRIPIASNRKDDPMDPWMVFSTASSTSTYVGVTSCVHAHLFSVNWWNWPADWSSLIAAARYGRRSLPARPVEVGTIDDGCKLVACVLFSRKEK
jgi:hypothetical protein